ncbi:unnamed protein product [Parnassius apollo]|uniref:(apollo) hypothetical protein n=1 Tax=Parnassius apollo TaxID=110799 RepID=A0A8S3Y4F8_PARAO|nr:unnamed protein product [Parnassius apollo]
MSDGSDIEMQSTLPKIQTKKIPKSPSEELLKGNQEPKRVSTKVMIHQALTDLKSRKGTSLYAIKKYIDEKYNVDIKKINNIIKKLIKAEVEAGVIIQTKGVGASGSFKLVVGKDKVEKKKEKIKKLVQKVKEPDDKPKKSIKSNIEAKAKESLEKKSKKSLEKKSKKKENVDNKVEIYKKTVKAKGSKEGKESKEGKMKKRNAKKMAKGIQTPAKKRAAMMKRKSIGSIIKPPKMRPKAKA